jgi:hypothetical protein
VKSNGFVPPGPPGSSGANPNTPRIAFADTVLDGLGTLRFSEALDLKKRPTRHGCSAGAALCPKTTTPAS